MKEIPLEELHHLKNALINLVGAIKCLGDAVKEEFKLLETSHVGIYRKLDFLATEISELNGKEK